MRERVIEEASGGIPTGIGPGFLAMHFGGQPFNHCVRELVKNCRDWGAGSIRLLTEPRHQFRIIDDGAGMDADNRSAFCSINRTTATGPRQSGKFDTGSKRMLFSHALSVLVRTAPLDDSDRVYVFMFTADEYERLLLARQPIPRDVLHKDSTSWPHQHPFGTDIIYTLERPASRAILRGIRLAEELAALLPIRYSSIVTVDGQPLPEKERIGDLFVVVEQHLKLGEVSFELYRPARRRSEDGLLLTSVEIGEVPMANLFRVLPTELSERIPTIYLNPEVCGTVSAGFFKDYVNEDRVTVNPAIADEPELRPFIDLLVVQAPHIERRLKLETAAAVVTTERFIDEIALHLNTIYGGKNAPTDTANHDGKTAPAGDNDGTPDPPNPPPIRIVMERHEFALGERIELEARIRKDLRGQYEPSDLRWYTDRSLAAGIQVQDDCVAMTASVLGHGVVRVDIPGTPLQGDAHYNVVTERVLGVSIPHASIAIGSSLVIMTRNGDLLTGDPVWEVEGIGLLKPDGRRAIYQATALGRALVTVADRSKPTLRATCDVTVTGKPRKALKIREHWFEPGYITAAGKRHVLMNLSGGAVHRITINSEAVGYGAAAKRGQLKEFFYRAAAEEYARLVMIELSGRDIRSLDPRDFSALCEEMLLLADIVYAEMIGKT